MVVSPSTKSVRSTSNANLPRPTANVIGPPRRHARAERSELFKTTGAGDLTNGMHLTLGRNQGGKNYKGGFDSLRNR